MLADFTLMTKVPTNFTDFVGRFERKDNIANRGHSSTGLDPEKTAVGLNLLATDSKKENLPTSLLYVGDRRRRPI